MLQLHLFTLCSIILSRLSSMVLMGPLVVLERCGLWQPRRQPIAQFNLLREKTLESKTAPEAPFCYLSLDRSACVGGRLADSLLR